jgi:hypothetical protein
VLDAAAAVAVGPPLPPSTPSNPAGPVEEEEDPEAKEVAGVCNSVEVQMDFCSSLGKDMEWYIKI